MALNRFKLVNTDGLKGLNFNGDFVDFNDIDDKLAEKLIGKTHVLERVSEEATAPLQLAIAEATATEEATPATGRARRANS